MALWNSPRQREAYTWLTSELSNLRAAFRWASDRDDLDAAAAIAIYATPLGNWIEQHEPNTWAGELIQRAEAVDHRRLPELYVMAAQCCLNGRIEEAIGYAEPGRLAIVSGRFDPVSFGYEAFLMNGYLLAGQPERCVDWCREVLARDPGADPPYARLLLAQLLSIVNPDEAKAISDDLLRIADGSRNPHAACMALFGYGFVHTNERPDAAYRTLRRGLKIAQDSGNRQYESHFALGLSRLAVTQGDPIDALDFLTVAIRNHHDSGSFAFLLLPLASLGALFERLGLTEPAATVFGFAATPFTLASLPEIGDAVSRVRRCAWRRGLQLLGSRGRSDVPLRSRRVRLRADRPRPGRTPAGGHLPMSQLAHSGVMTFLFTDIEGSTRRWEADAEGMRSALAAHDARLRDAIEAHDGLVVQAHR